MFSLVIVLISIVLVGALVLATLYFGGSATTDSHARAGAARLLNESQQISGAATTFAAVEQRQPTSLDELVSERYLSAPPSGAWSTYQGAAVLTDVSDAQCLAMNVSLGLSEVPTCADAATMGRTVCCSED